MKDEEPFPASENPNVTITYDILFENDASLLGEKMDVHVPTNRAAYWAFWQKIGAATIHQSNVKSISIRHIERKKPS